MTAPTDATPPAVLSAGGARLQAFLDGLPVEANWIAGHRVVWQELLANAQTAWLSGEE